MITLKRLLSSNLKTGVKACLVRNGFVTFLDLVMVTLEQVAALNLFEFLLIDNF